MSAGSFRTRFFHEGDKPYVQSAVQTMEAFRYVESLTKAGALSGDGPTTVHLLKYASEVTQDGSFHLSPLSEGREELQVDSAFILHLSLGEAEYAMHFEPEDDDRVTEYRPQGESTGFIQSLEQRGEYEGEALVAVDDAASNLLRGINATVREVLLAAVGKETTVRCAFIRDWTVTDTFRAAAPASAKIRCSGRKVYDGGDRQAILFQVAYEIEGADEQGTLMTCFYAWP